MSPVRSMRVPRSSTLSQNSHFSHTSEDTTHECDRYPNDVATDCPSSTSEPFSMISMVPLELSQYLELYSKDQASCEYDTAPHSSGACRQKEATPTRRAVVINHIEVNRGSGDDVVACLSFGRVSSLVIVVFLLSNCVEYSFLFVMMGAVASTILAANELRHETLMIQTNQEILRQSMQETNNSLMHAIHDLRQLENELMTCITVRDLGHSASMMLERE
jgi:hypothetical protein